MEKRKGSSMAAAAAAAATVFVVVLLGLVRTSAGAGAVYTVGGSAGWTIVGNVNYTAWASTNKFRVGDIILFVYNSNFHNVMEVSKADYKACNAASPLSMHKSGNDSFVIKRAGHHFFICGVPGHCAIGQKVDIRIPKVAASSAAPSGSPTTSPSAGVGAEGAGVSGTSTPVSSPRPNGAVASPTVLGLSLAVLASAILSAAVL